MNRKLLHLMRTSPVQAFSVSEPKNADTAEITIYDAIDSFWGIDPKQFIAALNAIKSPNISLRINSPGGFVFDGMAIYNAIKNHPAKITAIVDGVAASIASVIAMAADEIVMNKGTMMMIHDPWTMTAGNADDLRKDADLLDKIKGELVDIYAARSARDKADIAAKMAAETWFTADEAVAYGLASRVDGAKEAENVPADLLKALYPKAPANIQSPAADKPEEKNPVVAVVEAAPGNPLRAKARLRLAGAQ